MNIRNTRVAEMGGLVLMYAVSKIKGVLSGSLIVAFSRFVIARLRNDSNSTSSQSKSADNAERSACVRQDQFFEIINKVSLLNKAGAEFSQFSKKEFLSIKNMCVNLQKKYYKLTKENSKLIEELSVSESNLAKKSVELQGILERLSEDGLALKAAKYKLNKTMNDFHDVQVRLDATQDRCEKISNEYAKVLLEFDQQSRDLLSARSNLESLKEQNLEMSTSLDSAARRVSEAEARERILEQEMDHCRSELDDTRSIIAQNSVKITELGSQSLVLRKELEKREADLAKSEAERIYVEKEKDKVLVRLEERSRQYDAKVDGLSKMKTFLSQALESQRKQTMETVTKLSQSEQRNNNLMAMLEELRNPDIRNTNGDTIVNIDPKKSNSKESKIVVMKGGVGSA